MLKDVYRGYLLIRLSKIGIEWDISEKIMKFQDKEKKWEVTYVSPIYGSWDLIVEVSFEELEDFDQLITKLRSDEYIRDNMEELTSLVSSRANYLALRDKYKKI